MSCASVAPAPREQKWVSESIVSWERDCVFGGRERESANIHSSTPGWSSYNLAPFSSQSHIISGNVYCYSLAPTHPSSLMSSSGKLPNSLRAGVLDDLPLPPLLIFLTNNHRRSGTGSPLSRRRRKIVRSSDRRRATFPRHLQLRVATPKIDLTPVFPPSLSGILVNLHHSPASSSSPESSSSSSRHCGSINTNVVQQVVAAKWATDVINNQSLPYELKIGE